MNPTKNNNLGTFTNRIKDLRLLNRYTQDHVASVLGIPRTVYLNVEQGNRDLKLKEVRILASLYDMSIDELTYGTSTKNNNLPEPEHHRLANEGELRLEGIAMNIVHQIGDALYDALPPEIAHEYFVAARQATNDAAIDFAKKLLTSEIEKAKVEALEIFVPVRGYEGLYEVSNTGKVRSIPRGRNTGTELKQSVRSGYRCVSLSNGKARSYSVHRLVADAFLSNPSRKPTVNHIDLDKSNNNVINLEWATHSENEQHSHNNGKVPWNKGSASYVDINCINCGVPVSDRAWKKRKYCTKSCHRQHEERAKQELSKLQEEQ